MGTNYYLKDSNYNNETLKVRSRGFSGNKIPVNGGEIFNDYVNNDSNIPYAHISGRNNKAILKCFLITEYTINSITLDNSEDIASGMRWNIFCKDAEKEYIKHSGYVDSINNNIVTLKNNDGSDVNILDWNLEISEAHSFFNTFICDGGTIGSFEITDIDHTTFSVSLSGENNIGYINARVSGTNSKGLAFNAIVDGYECEVNNEYGAAFNYQTKANGEASASFGRGTQAEARAAMSIGEYNEIDTEKKYRFQIGKGTDDKHRSDAFNIDLNGNGKFAGNIFSNDKKVATEEFVKNKFQSIENNSQPYLIPDSEYVTKQINKENITDSERLQYCFDELEVSGGIILLDREYELTDPIIVKHLSGTSEKRDLDNLEEETYPDNPATSSIYVKGIGKNAGINCSKLKCPNGHIEDCDCHKYAFIGAFTGNIEDDSYESLYAGDVTFSDLNIWGLTKTTIFIDMSAKIKNDGKLTGPSLLRISFNNCTIGNMKYVAYSSNRYLQTVHFTDCTIRNVGSIENMKDEIGSVVYCTSAAMDIVINSCIIEWCGELLHVGCPGGISIANSLIEGFQGIPIVFTGSDRSYGLAITNNYFEKNAIKYVVGEEGKPGINIDLRSIQSGTITIQNNRFHQLKQGQVAIMLPNSFAKGSIIISGNDMNENDGFLVTVPTTATLLNNILIYGNNGETNDPSFKLKHINNTWISHDLDITNNSGKISTSSLTETITVNNNNCNINKNKYIDSKLYLKSISGKSKIEGTPTFPQTDEVGNKEPEAAKCNIFNYSSGSDLMFKYDDNKSISIPLNLSKKVELNGIQASDGKWYCDTIDFDKNVYTQQVIKYTFNNSSINNEQWLFFENENSETRYGAMMKFKTSHYKVIPHLIVCDRIPACLNVGTRLVDNNSFGIDIVNKNNEACICVRLDPKEHPYLENLKATSSLSLEQVIGLGIRQMLCYYNTEIYFVLETPIEIPNYFTLEELDKLANIRCITLPENITYLTTDMPIEARFEYINSNSLIYKSLINNVDISNNETIVSLLNRIEVLENTKSTLSEIIYGDEK